MLNIRVILIVIILNLSLSHTYRIYYMEDNCIRGITTPSTDIFIDKTGMNSTGILKATDFAFYSRGLNCSVNLIPPDGYGLVVSIKYVDFRNELCKDYVQLVGAYRSFHECGPIVDDSETRSYIFLENITVVFHTEHSSLSSFASGFQLTFTTFNQPSSQGCKDKTSFLCNNFNCIWNGLLCDGHNNCGDKSDEDPERQSHCGVKGTPYEKGVFIFTVILFSVLFGMMFSRCKWRRVTYSGAIVQRPLTYGTYSGSSYQLPWQASVSSSRPQMNVEPHHSDPVGNQPRESSPPPPYTENPIPQ